MKTRWISSPQDRPRCRAADVDGRRCREPVLWDERANRPLSTRCEVHGGLADASVTAQAVPAQAAARGKHLRGLPALALVVGLCLSWAAPVSGGLRVCRGGLRQGRLSGKRNRSSKPLLPPAIPARTPTSIGSATGAATALGAAGP